VNDTTLRFSNRVENYLRYRPHYPSQLLEFLKFDCNLTSQSIIADIGSGTGFLAEQFLANGNRVFGIEPNREMREAGEQYLRTFSTFTSLNATAEDTGLEDASVDFVTAGQAFHWFDRQRCREEFRRILRPCGWVVLVWNDRRTDSTPFLTEYERLLRRYGADYVKVDHKQIDADVLRTFLNREPVFKSLPNNQRFDLPSLTGRLLSASYVPAPNEPGHQEMLDALNNLFEAHQNQGRVTLEYDTILYYGRFA